MPLDTQQWLDALKVAILSQDDQKAFVLTQNLPTDLAQSSLESKLQARELISQTLKLLAYKKQLAKTSMEQIKAAKTFLEN
ncbi:hypothetical protein [Helicobacter equorum]|uniref:PH domain-containing protein n=1 Tax=Helicobacter equorum TaxID=361872 RepID=A0A3D8IS20_9HELI|nr:hypothetical protein [Helicobacter equorum]MBR2113024.1 hypothetical protein [Helicobacter sp.]MCI6312194.1 hypothetical protein [Helicobacter sp.]MCI7711582.1 hypothetical protein [Helicobacter sp.]MDD7345644.1 hypothetical protein [Helicobacter sp.]MDY2822783.1 hypothetical protein [Helicobacter sp.]